MKLLNFARSRPAVDTGPAPVAVLPPPSPAPRNPRESLQIILKTYATDYVRRANILSPDENDLTHLIGWSGTEVDANHRPYPEADRERDTLHLAELSTRIKDYTVNIERAQARVTDLERKATPRPSPEKTSVVVTAGAIMVYAVGIGASAVPLFAQMGEEDAVLAWLYALVFGAAVGSLITYAILGLEDGDAK